MADERIPLARPTVGEAELAAVERVLASGRLTNGPAVERFEAALARRCERTHAVALSSGTAALEIALWALGIGAGDEVLIPSFGFPSAAIAVAARGGTPVPYDVELATWNPDVADAAARVTAATRAIVAIDQFGLVAESGPLMALAADAGIALIDDAACALGGTDSAGVCGGGYGQLATLSFHPRKLVTTGEGGALVTDDDALATAARRLRNLGQAGGGQFDRIGTNARLSDVAAAIGTVQLGRLDDGLAVRRLLADGYRQRLASLRDSDQIWLQEPPAGAMHCYQTFAVLLSESHDRDAVRARLDAADIECGPGTYAAHRVPVLCPAPVRLPVSDALHERSLALPLFVGMRSAQLDRVVDTLREALA